MWVKDGLWIERFPELWTKGRRWSGCLSSPATLVTVGKQRMLCCPRVPQFMPEATQSSAVGTLSCEVHKLLLEWACPLSQNLVTLLHLPNIWYSNTLQISEFFCQPSQTWPVTGHCALEICSFWETVGCCQKYSVSPFVTLMASFSSIKTHTHWKFFDSTAFIFQHIFTTFSVFHSFTPWVCRLYLTLLSQWSFLFYRVGSGVILAVYSAGGWKHYEQDHKPLMGMKGFSLLLPVFFLEGEEENMERRLLPWPQLLLLLSWSFNCCSHSHC